MRHFYKQILFFSLMAFLLPNAVLAQSGGRGTYDFLNVAIPARVAALGGNTVAIDDDDIQLTLFNPALITEGVHNQLGLSYVDYFSDIHFSSIQYGRSIKDVGNFVGTLQYHNYGTFEYADEAGNRYGNFYASDFAAMLGWGRQLDSSFSIGAQAKFINSSYESYHSFGIAVDVAGIYQSNSGWLFSLTARNIGSELKSYLPGDGSVMPFSMQLAASKRLEHVPFRFMIVYDHLQKWDLTYDDPIDLRGKIDPITGTVQKPNNVEHFADQLMRHFILGGELYIGKNLSLRASYNYKRRQEMVIPDKLAMIGFAWGVGIKVSKFEINYSRSTFHVIGSPNYFSISTNLDEFKR